MGCSASALGAITKPDGARAQRLEAVQEEMRRLQRELAGLEARERSLLGDVARLDTEIALRRAELEEIRLRLQGTEARLQTSENGLATIAKDQARRAPLLSARLRELYKRGQAGLLARTPASWRRGEPRRVAWTRNVRCSPSSASVWLRSGPKPRGGRPRSRPGGRRARRFWRVFAETANSTRKRSKSWRRPPAV
jgi:hypothetical protein